MNNPDTHTTQPIRITFRDDTGRKITEMLLRPDQTGMLIEDRVGEWMPKVVSIWIHRDE